MRYRRKLALAAAALIVSAVGGLLTEQQRFSRGKGASYRRFLDGVIRFRTGEQDQCGQADASGWHEQPEQPGPEEEAEQPGKSDEADEAERPGKPDEADEAERPGQSDLTSAGSDR